MLVDFYQTAAGREVIKEFLNGLPDKELAKVLHEIELLELYGTELQGPHTKHIDGPIWELRTKFSSNIHRIFYFVWNDNKIILLHGFTKKRRKRPLQRSGPQSATGRIILRGTGMTEITEYNLDTGYRMPVAGMRNN